MSEEIINSSDSQESPGWETQLQTRAKEVINQQVGQQVSQRIGPLKNEIARLQSAIAELQSKLDEPSEPVEEEPETGGLLDYVKQWFSESSSKAEQNFNAKVEQVRAEYAKVADAHRRAEADKLRLSIGKARGNALKTDWGNYTPPKPTFTGTRVFSSYDLAELARHIDWTPFFQTWELKGRFPAILEDEKQGEAARALYSDAQDMLKRIIDERWFNPRAVIGFWPANSIGDDIALWSGESRSEKIATLQKRSGQLAAERSRLILSRQAEIEASRITNEDKALLIPKFREQPHLFWRFVGRDGTASGEDLGKMWFDPEASFSDFYDHAWVTNDQMKTKSSNWFQKPVVILTKDRQIVSGVVFDIQMGMNGWEGSTYVSTFIIQKRPGILTRILSSDIRHIFRGESQAAR